MFTHVMQIYGVETFKVKQLTAYLIVRIENKGRRRPTCVHKEV